MTLTFHLLTKNILPQLFIRVQRHVSTKLEVSTAFCFE